MNGKTWFAKGMPRRPIVAAFLLPLFAGTLLGACGGDRTVFPGEEIPATGGGRASGSGTGGGGSTNPNGRPGGAVTGFNDGTVPPGNGEADDDAILYGNGAGSGTNVATGADAGPREAGAGTGTGTGTGASDGGASDGGRDGGAAAVDAAADAAVAFNPGGGTGTNTGVPPCAILAAHEQVCDQAPVCAYAAYRQCRRAEVRGGLDSNFVVALQTCVQNTCTDFDLCFLQAMRNAPRTPTYSRMVSAYCNTCYAKNALCGIDPDQALPGLQQYADRTLARAEGCVGFCGDDNRFGDCLAVTLAPRIPLPGVCADSY